MNQNAQMSTLNLYKFSRGKEGVLPSSSLCRLITRQCSCKFVLRSVTVVVVVVVVVVDLL